MYFNRQVRILYQKVCGGISIKYMNVYMVCKLIDLMTKPRGGYTILYTYMYMCLHDHDYVMNFYFYGDIT